MYCNVWEEHSTEQNSISIYVQYSIFVFQLLFARNLSWEDELKHIEKRERIKSDL